MNAMPCDENYNSIYNKRTNRRIFDTRIHITAAENCFLERGETKVVKCCVNDIDGTKLVKPNMVKMDSLLCNLDECIIDVKEKFTFIEIFNFSAESTTIYKDTNLGTVVRIGSSIEEVETVANAIVIEEEQTINNNNNKELGTQPEINTIFTIDETEFKAFKHAIEDELRTDVTKGRTKSNNNEELKGKSEGVRSGTGVEQVYAYEVERDENGKTRVDLEKEEVEITNEKRKRNTNYSNGWKLNPEYFGKLVDEWGLPDVDLFASNDNKQVNKYIGTDLNSFAFDWSLFVRPYANPPYDIIPDVVRKFEQDKVENMIIVVPKKEEEEWFKLLETYELDRIELGQPEDLFFPELNGYSGPVGPPPFEVVAFRISVIPKNQLDKFDYEKVKEEYREPLKSLLEEYRSIFSSFPGRTDAVEHQIELIEDTEPIQSRPYRLSPAQTARVRQLVDQMLRLNVIQQSTSNWSSPIVLVKKPNGGTRFCVDYRLLNKKTKRDCYPIPNLRDLLDGIGPDKLFTSLDLTSGYWQVNLDKKAIEKTAFITPFGLYEFLRVPFGLVNAPATFQRLMSNILNGLNHVICQLYFDDILVHSKVEIKEHLDRLRQVFQRLSEAGLTLNLDKCTFMTDVVKFLGHIVDSAGIHANPEKIRAVLEFPVPTNVTELQSFLGVVTFYHTLIEGFAQKANPVYGLLAKGVDWRWTNVENDAFEVLKMALVSDPVLKVPNFELQFILTTDASNIGIGAVLSQEFDSVEHPVGYFSRTLKSYQKNYNTTEKECLGMVDAMKFFRIYLLDKKFRLRTDHKALKDLQNYKGNNLRVLRWVNEVQELEFIGEWRAGSEIANADGLSRGPLKGDKDENNDEELRTTFGVFVVTFKDGGGSGRVEDVTPEEIEEMSNPEENEKKLIINKEVSKEEWKKEIENDTTLSKWKKKIGKQEGTSKKEIVQNEEKLIMKNTIKGKEVLQEIVPEKYRKDILKLYHDSILTGNHTGETKTYDKIRNRYNWPGLRSDVIQWIQSCNKCQIKSTKNQQKNLGFLKPIETQYPFEIVNLDHVGPLQKSPEGYLHILTIVDHFSNYTILVPCKGVDKYETAELILTNIYLKYGIPRKLLSDRGGAFLNEVVEQVNRLFEVKHLKTTAYHPQCNGKAENKNRTTNNILTNYVNSNRNDWNQWLPFVEFAINTSANYSGLTPFDIMFGRSPNVPGDIINYKEEPGFLSLEDHYSMLKKRLATAYDIVRSSNSSIKNVQQKYYNRYQITKEFKVGDLVLITIPKPKETGPKKFSNKYSGPYEIMQKRSALTYQVRRLGEKKPQRNLVNIGRMKLYKVHKWRLDEIGLYVLENEEEVSREEGEIIIAELKKKEQELINNKLEQEITEKKQKENRQKEIELEKIERENKRIEKQLEKEKERKRKFEIKKNEEIKEMKERRQKEEERKNRGKEIEGEILGRGRRKSPFRK